MGGYISTMNEYKVKYIGPDSAVRYTKHMIWQTVQR